MVSNGFGNGFSKPEKKYWIIELMQTSMRIEFLNSKCIYFTLCLITLLCEVTFSQSADAGRDKVNCDGKGVTIGGEGEPDWCYSWKPEEGLDDPNILNPKANPTSKTTYTLTVTGPDFSFKSTDDVEVDVLELQDAEYKQNNESLYGKKQTGSACIGKPYQFRVNTEPAGGSPALSWEIKAVDTNREIDKGTGSSFTHTFSTELDKGVTQVRFYCDADDNSEFDSDESNVTVEFEIRDVTVHTITVARAATVSISPTNVAAILNEGSLLVNTRQLKEDCRCCTSFVFGGLSTFTPSATMPDVIKDEQDYNNVIQNVHATVRVVNTINWCGKQPIVAGFVALGCAGVGARNSVVVAQGAGGMAWAHELGHTYGLQHNLDSRNNVMFEEVGPGTLVNVRECLSFERK